MKMISIGKQLLPECFSYLLYSCSFFCSTNAIIFWSVSWSSKDQWVVPGSLHGFVCLYFLSCCLHLSWLSSVLPECFHNTAIISFVIILWELCRWQGKGCPGTISDFSSSLCAIGDPTTSDSQKSFREGDATVLCKRTSLKTLKHIALNHYIYS